MMMIMTTMTIIGNTENGVGSRSEYNFATIHRKIGIGTF